MQTLMYQNEDLMTILRLLCILSHTQVSTPTAFAALRHSFVAAATLGCSCNVLLQYAPTSQDFDI